MRIRCFLSAYALCLFSVAPYAQSRRDTMPDTWAATDGLGRKLPGFAETGPPRKNRTVGIFYFLWLGQHGTDGPYDVTRILAMQPDAMQHPESPLWGPLHYPHYWGEPLFDYYRGDDEWVLRKHAQMLSDAGIDVVIFDVTNQVTYRNVYTALCKVFSDVRRLGGRTPRIAFLTPFWEPRKVVLELWRDLYSKGEYADLWFRWEGKPLILADPDLLLGGTGNDRRDTPVPLTSGDTLGQSFRAEAPFSWVAGCFPTWAERESAMTMTLRRDDPARTAMASARLVNLADNGWAVLRLGTPAPPGEYVLEVSEPKGRVGWWTQSTDVFAGGSALANGSAVSGDRTIRIGTADSELDAIAKFFTFRKPQPDYFQGPTRPNMWSWLEVYPQHVFRNDRGEREQMSVGVSQNAIGNRLGTLSEPGARGRTWHKGSRDTRPNAARLGLNFAEQFERALKEDPKFVFVTGWNEWIAGRFAEFLGVKMPVMFVDQYSHEFSRDIEPMKGGHLDDYYYQLVAFVRRFKGVRPPLPKGKPKTIRIDGKFDDWRDVKPEYLDDLGDTAHRDHPGMAKTIYTNRTGRNDFDLLKATEDSKNLYFYARTREPLTKPVPGDWMTLYLRQSAKTIRIGWEDRRARAEGSEVEVAVPKARLGGARGDLLFKWTDNVGDPGDPALLSLNGDTAPNGRFWYRMAR